MQKYIFFDYTRRDGKIFADTADERLKINEASFLGYCQGRGLLNYDVVKVLTCAGRQVKGGIVGQQPFEDPAEYWDGYDESTIRMHLEEFAEDHPELIEPAPKVHRPVLLPQDFGGDNVADVMGTLLYNIRNGFRGV